MIICVVDHIILFYHFIVTTSFVFFSYLGIITREKEIQYIVDTRDYYTISFHFNVCSIIEVLFHNISSKTYNFDLDICFIIRIFFYIHEIYNMYIIIISTMKINKR